MSDPREFNLREGVTVDHLGTLFGRKFYVEPFKNEDEREQFVTQLCSLVGVPLPETGEPE